MTKFFSLNQKAWILFCALAVILPCLLGYFHWPYADDLTNITQIGEFPSRWDWFTDKYMHWTGRVLTTACIAVSFYSIETHTLLSMALGAAWGCCGLMMWPVLRSLTGLSPESKEDWRQRVACMAAFVCFFWSSRGYTGECFYWPTGGAVYGLALLLNLVWLVAFLNLMRSNKAVGNMKMAYWIVGSILLGTSHEQLSAGVFVITGILALGLWVGSTKKERGILLRNAGPILVAYFIGLVLLYIAPGNIARFMKGTNSTQFDFARFFENFLLINQTIILHKTATHLLLGVLAGVLIVFTSGPLRLVDGRLSWKWIHTALVLGYMANIPIIYILSYVDRRLYFFPGIFLFILGAGLALPMAGWVADRTSSLGQLRLRLLAKSMVAAFLIAIVIFMGVEFSRAVNYRHELESVHLEMMKYQGTDTDVVVIQAEPKSPRLFGRCDFGGDPNDWINKGTATYYKIRSLREIPPAQH
ncbi:MAG: DUF6056 family protein [Verrucomicrobiota bacterium]|nr:DUF6056 family protein [Verrucomicrobiota bacterium]